MPDLAQILDRLASARRVLVAGHLSPDFDTLASSLALKLALEKLGAAVTVYNGDGVPPNMRFLPAAETVVKKLPARARFDAAVFLDSSSPDRFGEFFFAPPVRGRLGMTICIDHHLTPGSFTDFVYLDPQRASTGELVADVVRLLKIPFDRRIALCVYCALASDTGGFRYSNTNAAVFSTAAEMLAYGVDPWEVTTRLYESRPLSEVKLLGDVLDTLELLQGGRLAMLHVTQEMMTRSGAENYMLDGFVNMGRAIEGVEVSIFLKQQRDDLNLYKVSLRSKGTVNVAVIAARLGGGGHKNAAGGWVRGSLLEAKKSISSSVAKALKK